MDVRVDAAGGEDLALAGDDFSPGADEDSDARLNVGIAGLADAGDMSVLDADVGFDDSPVIENERIGDDRVDGPLASGDLTCPMPSRITLPPPNFTSSP